MIEEKQSVGSQSHLDPDLQPYQTDDGIKALTFYLCGFDQFATNTYTPEALRSLGYGKSGLNAFEASKQAVKDGKRGKVRYTFINAPAIKLQSFYEDQEKQFSDEERREARSVLDQLLNQLQSHLITREEFTARMCCLLFKTRIEFMNQWRNQTPFVRIANPGSITREKSADGKVTTVSHPGYVEVSADVSEETKKRLGLV